MQKKSEVPKRKLCLFEMLTSIREQHDIFKDVTIPSI